ncbi:hypothetical protein DPMN_150685 [Dreissena polymorpha]|uniref:Uncharacterized protein n=1 Tax=Dreissena polymorpha TaxID=45954 RepID=A0A9D4FE79_DREPO|nr:hypothetical protein DPMN_150685 [Dreissena polymorpha]
MYSGQKRDALYKLLHQIIETEFCLVVRDGLDEWVAPDGSNMAEPSMAGFPNDKCTVLTTSRPWKLANERIKNSQVDILLEMDGIDDPDAFSERILRCILDDSKDLKTTAMDIRNFISVCKLTELSYSPMWYTLVICTWVNKMEEEEHLKGSSLCALWTTLLESLCKKANDTTGYFNDLIPPPVKCFASTSYLQPIIQIINVISKAAFHLLFSPEQETSIVFNDHILSNYVSKSEREFALKAGILSQRKTKNISNASISFLHKSMQEFLAAYYIARNAYLIDDVISGHFNRHKEAYLDISLLFIFLCGLNITAANKLSGMMDEQNDRMVNEYCGTFDLYKVLTFDGIQGIIAPGYREAVLNEQTNIRLRLSYFIVNGNNLRDIYNIWKENTSNALALDMTNDTDSHSSPAHRDQTCPVEFDLSSCIKLKVLRLEGCCIKGNIFNKTIL